MTARILVVDDDEKVLEILERSLSSKGYRVRLASDGKSALASWEEEPPDMVVLDMMLPDIEGTEVLRRMRANKAAPDVPVLFLSANCDLEKKLEGLELGADDYLVKPFSLKELNKKLENTLTRSSRAKELEESKKALEEEVSKEHENYLQTHRELKRQVLSMKTLFSISQDLNRLIDTEELINLFALTIVGELKISSMAFFYLEKEGAKEFSLLGLKGFDRKKFRRTRIPREGPFAEWLKGLEHPGKIVRTSDRVWLRNLPDLRLAVFEYATPIVVKEKLKGVVFTGPKLSGEGYNTYDLNMLVSICNSAGIGLENSRLFKQLQTTYLSTVRTLVSIIEAKDTYTKGHTERVANYAVAIAEKMKLPKEQCRLIAFGAVLHDIGKLGVYESVLNKKGRLSGEEWGILRSHPVVGASIVENMEFLSGTVALVRHHHEHYDGSGYPDGLKGEEIPLGARIIAVADSYDAMTTNRPYRKAFSREKALAILKESSGTQFDPAVVASFVELIEKGKPGKNLKPERVL